MRCRPRPRAELPITTGRVGLVQHTGRIEFYNANPRGVQHEVWTGHVKHWQRPPRPSWGCSCGCGGSCGCNFGCSGSRLFAAMLVDPRWWNFEGIS